MKKGIILFFLLTGCSFSRGLEIENLKGKSAQDVQESYGEPVIVRHEEDKQMWAYKTGECHRLIFFDATQTVQFAESRGSCPE